MRKIGLLFMLLVVVTLASVVHAQEYVAMVMDVDENVQFKDGEPVEVMAFLEENDIVQIKKNAKIVIIFFESSMREEVSGPTTLMIGVSGSVSTAGRSTRIRRQSVDYLPPKAQIDKRHHQNFGNIAFRKLGPTTDADTLLVITSTSNTVYIPGARPLLTWKVFPQADTFTLTVQGDHGADTMATKKGSLRMSSKAQAPGRYTWDLEAKLNGKVVASRDGWYQIMTTETYTAMKDAKKTIQAEYSTRGQEEMVALSLLYQSYEMWDEMSVLLLAMHEKQPDNTEVIRKLRSINPQLLEKERR